MKDGLERREILKIADNPNRARDYLVTLQQDFHGFALTVRYVPDRDILIAASLPTYLDEMAFDGAEALENVVATLLSDIANELVARWLEVTLAGDTPDGLSHHVVMEERQPQWDNVQLLSRLKPLE